MNGPDLGYRYVWHVICGEEEPPPMTPTATSRARGRGAHLPRVWLAPRVGPFDLLGPDYTLLRLGDDVADSAKLAAVFAKRHVPLAVLEIDGAAIRQFYQRKKNLVLVRPDLHVAWRGDELPPNVTALAERVTGHVFSRAQQNPAAQALNIVVQA